MKSVSEVVYSSAKDLYQIGLMDEKAFHEFKMLCLPKNSKKAVIKKTKKLTAKKK